MFAQMNRGVEKSGGDFYDRRALGPLIVVWASFGILAGWVWLKWGNTGWPVGSFWWDELALSGAAHAMRQGMVPTVDFWSPLVLSLYMKLLTENWVGHQSAYVLECLLLGGVILAMFTALIGSRRMPASAYWLVGLIALSVVAPFNIGSTTEAQPGTVVNACSYNRFGGGVIAMVIMLPFVRRAGRGDLMLILWLGLTLAASALLKITVLQISWALIALWALLCDEKGWWRILIAATTVAILLLLPFGDYFDWGRGYGSALRDMSQLRASLLNQNFEHYLDLVLSHRVELVVVLLAALVLVWQCFLFSIFWMGTIVWALFSVGAICAYTLTNFGDSGLMPAVAVLWVMPRLLVNGVNLNNKFIMFEGALSVLRRIVGIAWLLVGGVYFCAIGYWAWQFNVRYSGGVLEPVPAQNKFLRNYYFERGDLEGLPIINFDGAARNYRRPSMYASYLMGLDQAVGYLSSNFGSRSYSVYALDFPAYAFSLVAGYRVPRNTYAWVLYGHEMTIDYHPNPRWLFSDVDILMLPKCSMAVGNGRLLKSVYRVWIESKYQKVASLSCWDVYKKLGEGI